MPWFDKEPPKKAADVTRIVRSDDAVVVQWSICCHQSRLFLWPQQKLCVVNLLSVRVGGRATADTSHRQRVVKSANRKQLRHLAGIAASTTTEKRTSRMTGTADISAANFGSSESCGTTTLKPKPRQTAKMKCLVDEEAERDTETYTKQTHLHPPCLKMPRLSGHVVTEEVKTPCQEFPHYGHSPTQATCCDVEARRLASDR